MSQKEAEYTLTLTSNFIFLTTYFVPWLKRRKPMRWYDNKK